MSETRSPATAALWLSTLAVIVAIACAVFMNPVLRSWLLAILVLGLIAGTVGIVLSLRARADARRRREAGLALASAVLALLLDAALITSVIFGVSSSFNVNHVELRGHGPAGITATYADDVRSYTNEAWPARGWARFNTKKSTTKITIHAPKSSTDRTVGCQIIWNGRIVADETSDDGTVTCRYPSR